MTCVPLYRKKSQRSKRLQNLLHSCNQPLTWGGLAMVIGRCSWIQFGAHDIISTIGLEKLYIYIYTHTFINICMCMCIYLYMCMYIACLCMHILYIQYYTVYIQYYCYYYTVYICTPIYIYVCI